MSYTLVTPYSDPDLDGVACAEAYAEFLKKQGRNVKAGVFGSPHREAQFVLEKTDLEVQNASKLISGAEDVIVVDASDLRGIADEVDPNQVSEIIDHRKEHHAEQFPNADAQIELVGAAATLIAEKFYENNVSISDDSALLLYGAIISNTMNFQASVTSERDREMADWLTEKVDIDQDFGRKMFEHKSEFSEPIKEVFLGDFSTVSYGGEDIGIAQLEIVDVKDFVGDSKGEIQTALKEIGEEDNLDYIFLTCADLEEGFNLFVTIDDRTSKLLSHALDVKFEENEALRDKVLLRKEIVPKLKDQLEG